MSLHYLVKYFSLFLGGVAPAACLCGRTFGVGDTKHTVQLHIVFYLSVSSGHSLLFDVARSLAGKYMLFPSAEFGDTENNIAGRML